MKLSPQEYKLLCKDVLYILRSWQMPKGNTPEILCHLLVFRELQKKQMPISAHEHAKELVSTAFSELETLNKNLSTLIDLRFYQGQTTLETGQKLNFSKDQTKKMQQQAINSLSQLIVNREYKLRQALLNTLEKELDAQSFTTLFGIQHKVDQLAERLLKTKDPWIIGLTGIGGIGKTSLAIAAVKSVVVKYQYESIAWVKLGQPATAIKTENITSTIVKTLFKRFFPSHQAGLPDVNLMQSRLNNFFKENRSLVIIDNLELPQEVTQLLPLLSTWSNPSKFLLTSRSWSPDISQALQIRLDDLTEDDAHSLFLEQAEVRGYHDLIDFPLNLFRKLYQLIGGNPLMIKLSVGLMGIFDFDEVINDLQVGSTQKIEETYKYIYFKLWASLTEEAKQLLEAMPMIGRSGAGVAQIGAMSRLDRSQTLNALNLLINRSLLELRGTTQERRYSIHPLTATFIATEIILLPDAFVADRGKYLE